MATQNQAPQNQAPQNHPLQKGLYDIYAASAARKERLNEEVARKALNMPASDDMQVTQTYNGLGGKAIAAILVATLLGAGGIGAGIASLPALLAPAPTHREAPSEAQPPGPAKTREFKVEFFSKDGEKINIKEQ